MIRSSKRLGRRKIVLAFDRRATVNTSFVLGRLPPRFEKICIIAAEVLLVIAIVCLLMAIWMPALFGARPGVIGR